MNKTPRVYEFIVPMVICLKKKRADTSDTKINTLEKGKKINHNCKKIEKKTTDLPSTRMAGCLCSKAQYCVVNNIIYHIMCRNKMCTRNRARAWGVIAAGFALNREILSINARPLIVLKSDIAARHCIVSGEGRGGI